MLRHASASLFVMSAAVFMTASESTEALSFQPAANGLRIAHFVEQRHAGRTLTLAARDIPVVDRVDVVVVGGGVAGAMAALSAANEDLSVILIEPRNYFGFEFAAAGLTHTAKHRPASGFTLVDAFYQRWGKDVQIGERLNTTRLKRVLHEAVAAEPRITPHFYTICSGAVMRGTRIGGVVIYNRLGRQIVLAKAVVDATADARVSAAAGAQQATTLHGENTARRTVRLHCDVSLPPGAVEVPGELGLLNDQILVRRNGDCVLEYEFPVTFEGLSAHDCSRAQIDSWRKGEAVLKFVEVTGGHFQSTRNPRMVFVRSRSSFFTPPNAALRHFPCGQSIRTATSARGRRLYASGCRRFGGHRTDPISVFHVGWPSSPIVCR